MTYTDSRSIRYGVIVGRFQTPILHAGHQYLIDNVIADNDITFIVIGVSEFDGQTEKNPYTFEARKRMIEAMYRGKVSITFLRDVPQSNDEWSKNLDFILQDMHNVTLYGSRDSFQTHYTGKHKYNPIEEVHGVSATEIRSKIKTDLVLNVFNTSMQAPRRTASKVMMQLMEEVGELAVEVAIKNGDKQREPGEDGVIGEAVDVIQCVIDLIYITYPDATPELINSIMTTKLAKWKSKFSPTI